MSQTMKAYVLTNFDEPLELTDVPVPEPGPGEVRVRVRASSVNPVDAAVARGFFRAMYEYRLPAVQGRDFAGTVDAVGPGVTTFTAGDEVFGMVKRDYIGDGTFAEFVVVDADRFLAPRPDGIDVVSAGAMGLAGVTALQCVDALGLRRGESVFINGATGGVGSFAIQIAKARGLQVIATARPDEEDRHVRALGADETIDWSRGETADAVRRVRPAGVDGVIDLISRDTEAFLAVVDCLSPTGKAVTTLSAAPGDHPDGRTLINVHSDSDPVLLGRLAGMVSEGEVRVPIVASFSFDRIDEAFTVLATGPTGKVAIAVSDS